MKGQQLSSCKSEYLRCTPLGKYVVNLTSRNKQDVQYGIQAS